MQLDKSQPPLGLASHVRARASDDQVILLDLRNSKYLGVGAAQSRALAGRVQGWPEITGAIHDCSTDASSSRLAATLLSRGLLTDTPSRQLPIATVDDATVSLDATDRDQSCGAGAGRIARFLRSAAATTLWLRWRSLEAIATAVQARRDRASVSETTANSLAQMKVGTATYDRLRPFVFTARENCLYDSLALVGFLASEGLFPRWVIGVKTRPFAAHSWVQMGSTVLNDQHETIRQFRSILVV